jgi:hypothetical protein
MFDGSRHSQVFVSLALIAGIVGSVSSSTVILLIRKMQVWNLHIALIMAMTVFELLYDISFFTGMASTGSFGLSVVSNVAQLQGGTTSSIVSNIIAAVALYVVYFKKTVDALKYYYLIVFVAVVPGVIINILYILAVSGTHHNNLASVAVLDIYYYIRLGSITINFICSIYTALLIDRMRSQSCAKTTSEAAISKLSMRLFYYPIVQAVGRSGCAWYEGAYGYNFAPDRGFNFNPSETSDTQFAAQCLMVISTPLISVGYLVIFLIMQPNAAKCLDDMLGFPCVARFCMPGRDESTDGSQMTQSALHKDLPSLAELSHIDRASEQSAASFHDMESMMSSMHESRMPSVDNASEANVNLFDMAN